MKKEKKDKHFIHKPIYEGGPKALRTFVQQHLRYPPAAQAAGIAGSVHLKYTIDKNGRVIDCKVISGLGYGCDEEAVRVVSLLTFRVPQNRKRHVLFHKKLAIHFRPPHATAAEPTTGYTYSVVPSPVQQETDTDTPSAPASYTYTVEW